MSKTKEHKGNILTEVARKKISRRSFIKWSSAIGATAAASGLIHSAIQSAPATLPADSIVGATGVGGSVKEWVPTHCLMCHSWCSQAIGIGSDGLVRKVEGQGGQPAFAGRPGTAVNYDGGIYKTPDGLWGNQDDAHWPAEVPVGYLPYGLMNKGRICAKGNSAVADLFDPDRIKYPLKRVGPRGSGTWQKISWRQAYWEIATVIRELHGHTTAPDGTTPIAGARAEDLRQRHVAYIGRNESDNGGMLKFGSPNRIEHTSICESSRHQSTLTLFGHHFPFPDLCSHTGTRNAISSPYANVDFMLEFGGNPCEAKIPMTAYGVRWGNRRMDGARIVTVEVRQSNTAAFSDEYLLINPGSDGALAMGILGVMFKEWGAAELKSTLLAGHLGGVTHNYSSRRWTGIFSDEKGSGPFTPSVAGANVAGAPTLLAGTTTLPAPTDTLEDELVTLFGPGMGTTDPATWAAGITGLLASDVVYLAAAVSGGQINPDGSVTFLTSEVATYHNPSVDGYRGPSKHTNGYYNWKDLRTLQVMAGRFIIQPSGPQQGFIDPTWSSGVWARGGIERPSGLMINGWGANTGGAVANYSPAAQIAGKGVGAASFGLEGTVTAKKLPRNTYPYASNKWNAKHDTVTIDRWDYEQGRNKFGIGTQGADQNTVPGIRASLGLHPYRVGATVTVRRSAAAAGDVILPYGFRQTAFIASTTVTAVGLNFQVYVGPHPALANLVGATATLKQDSGGSTAAGTVAAVNAATGTVDLTVNPGAVTIGDHLVCDLTDANRPDPDFEVESLMIFKNAPGNTRANIKLFQELVTATDGGGNYLLKNFWSIDAFMGDGTRFADIILPDTTNLERFDNKDWENMGLKGWYGMRQPVMRQDMTKDIWDPTSKELYLYEARPVNSIALELTNACAGTGTTYSGYTGASIMWSSNAGDEDYDASVTGTEGQPWDAIKLGGIGAWKQAYYNSCENGSIPDLALAPAGQKKWAFMRVFGNIHDANQVINEYTGFDSDFFGHGGWAKQNAPRTWLNDDLATAGVASWADNAAGPVNGYTALEVYNRRVSQILEPGLQVLGTQPAYSHAWGYKFKGVPVYQEAGQQTDMTYNLHLTTYKVNVHTQSRTAQNPILMEITGKPWALINPATAGPLGIADGDLVKVTTKQGWIKLEAKVTPRAQVGCVHISAHFGHEAATDTVDDIGSTQGVSTIYGTGSSAFGNYTVDGSGNRSDAGTYGYATIDAYTLALAPTAPGSGPQPNTAICRTNDDLSTSRSLATCPIGTSMAWFDSKCKIELA